MTPQQVLAQLDKALQETARLKRRLTRLQKTHLPTLYWDVSPRSIAQITLLQFVLQEDKQVLQDMISKENGTKVLFLPISQKAEDKLIF